MSSRGSGGSRYPSAYGHTPSYRSYNAGSTGLVGSGYPSALGTTTSSTADRLLKDFDNDKFFDSSLSSSRAFDKYDVGMPSTTGGSSASKKVASSSYSYSSTRYAILYSCRNLHFPITTNIERLYKGILNIMLFKF